MKNYRYADCCGYCKFVKIIGRGRYEDFNYEFYCNIKGDAPEENIDVHGDPSDEFEKWATEDVYLSIDGEGVCDDFKLDPA